MHGGPERFDRAMPLVLEDNLIIAMEIEELLMDLGFPSAQICGSISNALSILESADIAFAVLDIYLGSGETCAKMAQALAARGTPFIFISGFDGHASITDEFPAAPIVAKPFVASDVKAALGRIGIVRHS